MNSVRHVLALCTCLQLALIGCNLTLATEDPEASTSGPSTFVDTRESDSPQVSDPGPDSGTAGPAEPGDAAVAVEPPEVSPGSGSAASPEGAPSGPEHPEGPWANPDQRALEELGKRVFFDNISSPAVMSCATCHEPAAGWTGGDSDVHAGQVVVPGAEPATAGNRRPPSAAYASFTPSFGDAGDPGTRCTPEAPGIFCKGGLFVDGRARGDSIGDEVFAGVPSFKEAYADFLGPAADQAVGPFPNDVEQNVPDGLDNGLPGAEFVCKHVQAAEYAALYQEAWGQPLVCTAGGVDIVFKRIAVAISAWEHSAEVNSFSSRRDLALADDWDDTANAFPYAAFTREENLGQALFFGITSPLNPTGKSANCAICHNSEAPESQGDEPQQLYTDHRYHHLGLPPNHEIAHFDPERPDKGLSHHTAPDAEQTSHDGHFRTPTLRNVGKRPSPEFVKSYMHNGYFKNLEDVVHFYNTATLKLDPAACPAGTTAAEARARDCWPAPEIDNGLQSSAVGLFGDLGLTPEEEAAIVAFLRTLSDEETVSPPGPYRAY